MIESGPNGVTVGLNDDNDVFVRKGECHGDHTGTFNSLTSIHDIQHLSSDITSFIQQPTGCISDFKLVNTSFSTNRLFGP